MQRSAFLEGMYRGRGIKRVSNAAYKKSGNSRQSVLMKFVSSSNLRITNLKVKLGLYIPQNKLILAMTADVPRVYINLERDIDGLTVRLGSNIDDATVAQLVTWFKNTGRVKKVQLAKRNRYTNRIRKSMIDIPEYYKLTTWI